MPKLRRLPYTVDCFDIENRYKKYYGESDTIEKYQKLADALNEFYTTPCFSVGVIKEKNSGYSSRDGRLCVAHGSSDNSDDWDNIIFRPDWIECRRHLGDSSRGFSTKELIDQITFKNWDISGILMCDSGWSSNDRDEEFPKELE